MGCNSKEAFCQCLLVCYEDKLVSSQDEGCQAISHFSTSPDSVTCSKVQTESLMSFFCPHILHKDFPPVYAEETISKTDSQYNIESLSPDALEDTCLLENKLSSVMRMKCSLSSAPGPGGSSESL